MEIVYCENCGTRIPEADMNSGKAVKSGADYFCPDCVGKLGIKPDPPKPQIRRKTPRPMPRPRAPTRTPSRGVQAAPPSRARATKRTQGSSRAARQPQAASQGGQGSQGTMLFAVGACIVAFVLTLALILLFGTDEGRKKRKRPAPRAPVPMAPRREAETPRPTGSLSILQAPPDAEPSVRPVSPPPAGGGKTGLPDLEETKRAGEDWLRDRTGPCPKPLLEAPRAATPPVIDGELAEACWQAAGRASTFTTGPENVRTVEEVTVLICYDASALYVAFDCRDPDIKNVLRAATETGKAVWDDDSVELFFDADRDYGTYVQFLANVDGVTQTYEDLGGKPEETPIPGFEVKTKLYPDRWTAECSLSYAALRGTAPKAGTVWAVQFVKNGRDPGAEKNYSSSWAKLWGGSTHRPALFGFLSFK